MSRALTCSLRALWLVYQFSPPATPGRRATSQWLLGREPGRVACLGKVTSSSRFAWACPSFSIESPASCKISQFWTNWDSGTAETGACTEVTAVHRTPRGPCARSRGSALLPLSSLPVGLTSDVRSPASEQEGWGRAGRRGQPCRPLSPLLLLSLTQTSAWRRKEQELKIKPVQGWIATLAWIFWSLKGDLKGPRSMMGGWGHGSLGTGEEDCGRQSDDECQLSPALSMTGLHGVALWAPPSAWLSCHHSWGPRTRVPPLSPAHQAQAGAFLHPRVSLPKMSVPAFQTAEPILPSTPLTPAPSS